MHVLWVVMGFKWSVNIIISITIFITENYMLSALMDFIELLDCEVFNLTRYTFNLVFTVVAVAVIQEIQVSDILNISFSGVWMY